MRILSEQEFVAACNEHASSWDKSFQVSWSTGGTYGSCWSDTLTTASPDAPQELVCLDNFLAEYFPDISFMQYRSIINSVETTETRDGDYYGGCIYGIKKTLSYGDLLAKLETMKLVEIITAADE